MFIQEELNEDEHLVNAVVVDSAVFDEDVKFISVGDALKTGQLIAKDLYDGENGNVIQGIVIVHPMGERGGKKTTRPFSKNKCY